MSIPTDEECPINLWRRTTLDDSGEIRKLVKYPQTENLYGDRNIKYLVEKSNVSLCQENSVGRVISTICLCDHPNIPCLLPSIWLYWAKELYGLERLTVQNTYFIHFLVWSANYSNEFLKLLLPTIFINNYYLQHILLIVPPGAQTPDVIEEYFTRLLPIKVKESCNVQTILICMRQHHVPRLRIRKALEEDNDDIIPILESQNEDLRKMYGDFYIAEMIANPDKNREMVIAEHGERAIGFMSMNTNIDFQTLNEHFEMAPFYGLRKPHKNDNVFSFNRFVRDSMDGLVLPTVLESTDDLSRLSVLSSVLEDDISAFMPQLMDAQRTSYEKDGDSVSYESISFEESLFPSELDIDLEEEEEEEEEVSVKSEESLNVALVEKNEDEPFKEFEFVDIPAYFGDFNAFMIELFAMHRSFDERTSADFLEAAFECYPDLDYCILTIPPTCSCFPLLTYFVRVVPRPSRSFTHELYVCHKNSILSDITVREATTSDIPLVTSLISYQINKEKIQVDFEAAINYDTNTLQAFVVLADNYIIGLAVVEPEDEMLYLTTHYNIEGYANLNLYNINSHGVLKHFSLSPIFSCHLRFLLSEIMRLTDFTCLYYQHSKKPKKLKIRDPDINSTLEAMIPILPRRQMVYCLDSLEKNIPQSTVLRNQKPFSLYFMNKRFSTMPKFCVNTRIVVVGASETSLGFLKTLLFGPSSVYLTFNNVTLVSPHGLPGEFEIDRFSKNFFVYDGSNDYYYMNNLHLISYINIIYGKMTAINKSEKHIVINRKSLIQYDYLLLLCGEQFNLPAQYLYGKDDDRCVHGRKKEVDEPIKEIPQNVFLINTEIDGANSLKALKHFTEEKNHPPVIVYGNCLEAYCCIAALQEFGLKGHKICFVEPFGREYPHITCFNDKEVDVAVMESIQNGKVNILSGYYFIDWKFSKTTQTISKVKFESKTKTVTADCAAMFYFGNKCISKTTFLAIEQGQLVFDGRLVIDHNFKTSDNNIFAAGPCTKYARRYYANNYIHRYYNSNEIGERVAKKMLSIWDPTGETTQENEDVLPLFVKPLVSCCILPGKIFYLNICKPGITVPLETAMNRDNYGVALVTGSCNPQSALNYFRIHMNSFNAVETITCYSKESINYESYIALYGLHEKLLNNLIHRFETGYISDFYEYFKEPWCYAVLLDRFSDFLNDLSKVFVQQKEASFSALPEEIRLYFMITNWKKINSIKLGEFKMQYKMDHEETVRAKLIKYLSDNVNQLPMYAIPE
ncbi:hypothetical protein L9F63_010559, partial [Diploptera punctata]